MSDRKRIRIDVTLDVDYAPGTDEGFGGLHSFAKHVVNVLDLDGMDVVGDGDDFTVTVVGSGLSEI